ncbi:MAG: type II toxin-antitoxin system VapC family toxin [Anaerolineales bacterium]|nr:type II toxin-antitoxin system VapC family toxin [Anaerolineales bacterium]
MNTLANFTAQAVYLDTMLPYIFLRSIDSAAKSFFERIEGGEFLAYTSILTFDELAYRLLLAFIKDHYNGSPLDHLRNEENRMMTEFAPRVSTLLQRLKDFPNLITLDILASDLDAMIEAMTKYKLRPRDALHLAAMQRADCFNLASNDAHFDNVPKIQRFAIQQEL